MTHYDASIDGLTETWVPITEMPIALVCGAVKAEDRFFFDHGAFDISQTMKALRSHMLRTVPNTGGSTITQQLAKNLFLTPDRTLTRKARELFYAWHLDRNYSKQRILEIYLNVAQFGDDVWGVASASRHYFGVPVADLSPVQSVLLVSRLPAPTKPVTDRNRTRSEAVVRRVLRQLHRSGLLDTTSVV
jgi:monofunctional glycosyltransferase